ncbi:kinase-like domain-containing protein [Kockovaella imperatae]|uniref:non-specific serine/threonine protein kinase n=1 Tax=Kockovaella imperatae TaxID=4999 RepID=A0A1Y1USQ7_9TREE|nr:kinase-like domain-containing protein [Kockovaella imperatae]ORX41053.1 kinase-like domain-containing protein [Kockovaella imperatae]
MDHRPVLERTAIKAACHWLHSQMWTNWDEEEGSVLYKAVDRLGEGTFSSVFLARDLFHTKYDNEYWTGNKAQQVYTEYFGEDPTIRVALKKILVTSSPVRIENELSILESLRGSRNVSKLITAFRQDDQVIIVMSYHPCDDFRHFYRHMDVKHIRSYMRSLLRGLKEIHQRGIIHRDIKPANFLYDYATGQGAICDFGLAERYKPARRPTCQHSSASIRSSTSGKVRTAETPAVERAVYQARKRAKLGDGRVGFLGDDTRPSMKTNRAGTRGFRAPEVLLKCPDQSFAIDTWSAGIILLSILAQKFPIFNSTDDVEAMMEIAALFGRSALERCAMLHNRTLICNVPTLDADPQRTLKSIVLRLNPHLYTPPSSCPSSWEAEEHIRFIDHALRLLHGLLRLDCTSRFSASEALQHEFFSEEGEDMDQDFDDFEPVGIQDGKCGNLHGFVDGRRASYAVIASKS